MIAPTFTGSVKGGKFKPLNTALFRQAFYTFEGKECEVVVRAVKKVRSGNQNRYYHGVVVFLLHNKIGYSAEDMHDLLKAKFAPRKIVEDLELPKSTKQMTPAEMELYIEQIRAWSASFHNLYIPQPNECDYE